MRPHLLPAIAGTFLLAACVDMPRIDAPVPRAVNQPRFDALRFFAGRLEGRGTLHTLFGKPVDIRVDSIGELDGTALRLVQTIHEGSKPPRTRQWLIRETAPGRYTGTLSDAVGTVEGRTTGNRLRLTFTMRGDLSTEQWLTLAPDGRRAFNHLTVRKFGVPVARLAEDIRKLD